MKTFNLLGDIMQDDSQAFFESDVVPAMLIGWLAKQDGDVEININSLGGSVIGGLAMANAIKGYSKGKVTANVLGVAASMASVVACAADEIKMGKGSFLMIHNPWSVAMGDADDLRKEAETLDKMKGAIIGFYQSKFNIASSELASLMDAETWIRDDECAIYSLVAAPYTEEPRAAAHCDTRLMFAKAPAAAAAYFSRVDPAKAKSAKAPPAGAAADPEPAAETGADWEARYKGLMAKFNAREAEHKAALEEMSGKYKASLAEIIEKHNSMQHDLERQLSAARGDLEKAKADMSSAVERAETAEKSLAEKVEQVSRLEKAHSLLTAGVLDPGDGMTDAERYESDLRAARSPEQREVVRKARRSPRKTA